MDERHPSSLELTRFSQVELLSPSHRPLIVHLASCSHCRGRLERRSPAVGARVRELLANVTPLHAPEASSYRTAFARVMAKLDREAHRLEHSRSLAPALLAELVGQPQQRRMLLIRNSARFQTWGLAERLLDEARARWTADAREAEDLVRLALEVTRQLESGGESVAYIRDLKARGWAFLANARRIRSDLAAAEKAFAVARHLLAEGSGDPIELAQVLELEASLLRAQRRFEDGSKLLKRVIRAYDRAGEPHLAGRALINQALLVREAGLPAEGLPLLERAASLIDAQAEPRLLCCLRQNQLAFLNESGRAAEAGGMLPQLRRLVHRFGTRIDLLRFHWLAGDIAANLGQPERAEECLRRARSGFLTENIPLDVALVSLDLAILILKQGRTAETKELVAEVVPLFHAIHIQREALAAALLFAAAVERETLTLRHLEELSSLLRRAASARPAATEVS